MTWISTPRSQLLQVKPSLEIYTHFSWGQQYKKEKDFIDFIALKKNLIWKARKYNRP